MTFHEPGSGPGMTIDPVAPNGASLVRLATSYLEVETQPTSLAGARDPAGAGARQPAREEQAQARRST